MSDAVTFLATVGAVYFVLVASPGPNFVLITHAAASQSRRIAIFIGLGVSTISMFWAALAAMGLGILIHRFGEAWRILQIAGGVYLLYLAWQMLRSPGAATAANLPLPDSAWPAYRRGLLSNLGNPKSLAFFGSAFASLFHPGQSLALQLSAVAVVGAISVTWHMCLVLVFSNARVRAGYQRGRRILDRLAGGVLAALGLRMIADR